MVKENPKWGCVRIHGELLKVGHRVSITAIRNLLRKRRVPGSPERSGLSWKAFLKAQASAIVVTDFIEVDTVFLKRLYVLLYMELAARRVIWFGVTESPNAEWVAQQARNVAWELSELGVKAKFLIRDNDAVWWRVRSSARGRRLDRDQNSFTGPSGELAHRAPERQHSAGVFGLDADHQPTTPGKGAERVVRALQPGTPAPGINMNTPIAIRSSGTRRHGVVHQPTWRAVAWILCEARYGGGVIRRGMHK
jgi:hypothetical protein